MTKRTTPRPNIDNVMFGIPVTATSGDVLPESEQPLIRMVIVLKNLAELHYIDDQVTKIKRSGNRRMSRSEYIRQLIHKDAEEKSI